MNNFPPRAIQQIPQTPTTITTERVLEVLKLQREANLREVISSALGAVATS